MTEPTNEETEQELSYKRFLKSLKTFKKDWDNFKNLDGQQHQRTDK